MSSTSTAGKSPRALKQPAASRGSNHQELDMMTAHKTDVRRFEERVKSAAESKDVIYMGINFGPASEQAVKLVDAHRAAAARREAAYIIAGSEATPKEQLEQDAANRAATMASLEIAAFGSKSNKADHAMIMAYIEQAKDEDLEAFQSLIVTDIDVFRDAYRLYCDGQQKRFTGLDTNAHEEKSLLKGAAFGSTSMTSLIEAHRRACDAYNDSPFDDDHPEGALLARAMHPALQALLSARPATWGEARIRASYLMEKNALDLLDTDTIRLFLASEAAAPAEPEDPIIAIAHAAAKADAQCQDYEQKKLAAYRHKDRVSETYFNDASNDAYDLYCRLKSSMACYEAQSTVGAMAQLAEVFSIVGRAHSFEEGLTNDDKKTADRLILSALRFLERENGAGMEELGLGSLRNSNVDIWEPAENRVAAVKRDIS
jgi:hypothetical protein